MSLSASELVMLRPRVIEALSSIYDPEIPINIYELGLIYGVDISVEGAVAVRMTLTAPACPAAQSLPVEVEQKVAALPGVSRVRVDIVWDPPWRPDKIPEAARLQLGIL
jgi:FeS assembly SUF system protein